MRGLLLALVAASAAAAAAPSRKPLTLSLFDLTNYPLAVCNDGSPSGYYFSPSPSGTSAVWIIHQEGGGWAFDEASAKSRGLNLTSSIQWSPTYEMGGIFASSDPRLGDANLVYARYCTSDAWGGNIGASNVPFGFHFRGHQVVSAIFSDLVATRGLGAEAGTAVLYSGCSAGARGVLFNADRVGALLQTLVPSGHVSRFGALLDSAFWLDLAPFNASAIPFSTQVQEVYALANGSASVSPDCAAAFSAAEQWKCLMGEYAVPFLTSRYLLHSFLYDRFQLSWDFNIPFGGPAPDKTPQQIAYSEGFRNLTEVKATADTIAPARSGTAALLPGCYLHCNTEGSGFGTLATLGVTLEQAVLSWFFGDASVPAYVSETCAGFNCGPDCPAAAVQE
jgi:hypothetical protein